MITTLEHITNSNWHFKYQIKRLKNLRQVSCVTTTQTNFKLQEILTLSLKIIKNTLKQNANNKTTDLHAQYSLEYSNISTGFNNTFTSDTHLENSMNRVFSSVFIPSIKLVKSRLFNIKLDNKNLIYAKL